MGGDTNVGGDGGNNGSDDGDDDDDDDEMVGSNKNVYRDNVNVGDGKNKVDLGDVHSGGDDSNVDDASCGNDDSKFHGGDDIDRSDCDDKNDRMLMMVVMLTLILVTNDAIVVMERAKLIALKT